MVIDLDNLGWIVALGRGVSENPERFSDSLEQAGRGSLVFGSAAAREHRVFGTALASFELLNFEIE